MIAISQVLGEFRLQFRGCFVGCELPNAEPALVVGEDVCLRLGVECDSLGFVFSSKPAALLAAASINNQLRRFRL